MTDPSAPSPETILGNYRLPDHPLYLIGIFDRGVTVYSQQIRALNLIWALVEQGILACKLKEDAPDPDRRRASIAIIGGGFAGLTAAAALIKKGVDADITIFEHCDTLLRQDRILEELIVRRPALHKAVKALRENFPESKSSMFAAFEALDHEPEFQPACDALKRRLRRDTDAILHLKKRMLAELFDDAHLKIAFQNHRLPEPASHLPTIQVRRLCAELHGDSGTGANAQHPRRADRPAAWYFARREPGAAAIR
jgi:hypothetical protein